jgi:hypothetical protein
MIQKIDHRLEALKELGAMIAEDYRRRMANGIKTEAARPPHKEDIEKEDNFEIIIRLHDPECNGLYTETVDVENFLRNHKARSKKLLMRQIISTETKSKK